MKKFILYFYTGMFTTLSMAQTPVVYFPFDGQSVNSSDGNYTLDSKTGSAAYTAATKSGNGSHALSLDGGTHLSTPFTLDTNAKGFTAAFWMKRANGNARNGILVTQLEVHNIQAGITVYPATFSISLMGGKVYTEWYLSNLNSTSILTADTLDLNWNHIALVWKKNSASAYHLFLFINGNCKDSIAASDKINISGNSIPLSISGYRYRKLYPPASDYSTGYFTGLLDEIKIFDTDLKAQQIQQLYQGSSSSVRNLETQTAAAFPNPAYDQVSVRADFAISRITISDCSGKLIQQYDFNGLSKSEMLRIGALKAGNYVIKITGETSSKNLKLMKL